MSKPRQTKLSRISVFFYERVFLSATLWSALFLFGLFSYTVFLQRQGFPAVNVPVSIVQGVYFVDNKQQLDNDIAKPISQALVDLPAVKSVKSSSFDNQVTVLIQYNEGTDAVLGSQQVQNRINQLSLPDSAQFSFQPIDATRFNNTYDVLLSVNAQDRDLEQLQVTSEEIVKELKKQLPEAVLIEVVSPFEEGVNPQTGQQEKQQTSFDWDGQRRGVDFVINPSVVIGIQAAKDTDVLGFDTRLSGVLETLSGRSEFAGVNVAVAGDFASSIRDQIGSLQKNLIEGLLIVIAVCLVFIGLRAGLLAAIGMLMTLSITAAVLFIGGLSLNTITLFGLVLCLGLIVDDTIIIIEAIDAQRRRKKSLKEAIAVATRKVALASVAGTLTTVLGFAPLLFIGGILGDFIRVLPITIIVSLLTSLVVSLLFIPFVSRWFLSGRYFARKNTLSSLRNVSQWIGDLMARLIERAKTRRQKITFAFIAISVSIGFILTTGPLFGLLKFDIFPATKDSNQLQVEFTFVPGTDIVRAKDITGQANEKIKAVVGTNLERITYQGAANSRQANASITLVSYEKRDQTARDIVKELEPSLQTIEGARIVVSQVSAGPPKDQFPFGVQIPADDPDTANTLALRLADFLNNREIARPNGTKARISEVQYTAENISVTRIDGKRIIEVRAAFDADDISALVQSTEQEVRNEFLNQTQNIQGINSDAVVFDFGSETENQESFSSVLVAIPFLVLAMYILLALQFRSFLQPLLILVAVPFSFFGVAIALLLTDNPLSFFVMVAFFALIGISVNNTILLTDYANQGRRAGMSPRMAMATAVRERMRPLLTTSVTSILALLPLALTDPFWESLAVTLIGGLAASTILVIVSFPYYYLVLEAIRSRLGLWWKQKKQEKSHR